MAVRPIRILGDPILREQCRPVVAVDEEVRALIEDLRDTMREAEGVGLAAPQLGVPLRVFVYEVPEPEPASGALVNPRIVSREGSVKEVEGCLSIPGLSELVTRAARVTVEGLDGEGREVRLEAEALLGRCLQHEIDHLDGILFLDHLSPLKRKMLLSRWAKMDDSEKEPVRAL